MVTKCYTLALLTIAVALVAAGTSETVVRMTDGRAFEPKTVNVKVGDTVVWKNVSSMSHTVTDKAGLAITATDAGLPVDAKEFDSGLISPGKDYSHTFTVVGTYKYFCIPHEGLGMVGTVVVSK